ncbi:MAG: hypothetical protein LBR94_05660 [Desulfovibrio sp.]|jgi:hypothetical protein|nr:hypothetical protein [Desulfovibrio sp.]
MSQAIAIQQEQSQIVVPDDSVTVVAKRVNMVHRAMREVMHNEHHYGKIPGCGNKPTLLKPGAEILFNLFQYAPMCRVDIANLQNGHREYTVTCTVTHIPSGMVVGQGMGSCSTMESKYRYRNAERVCPECGQTAIIKGKAEFGGGWLCFAKKDGCGAKFKTGDERIEGQTCGKVENEDIADCYNTCLKMAEKRAKVDAALSCTSASDIFTQDIEDNPELYGGGRNRAAQEPAPQKAAAPRKAAKPKEIDMLMVENALRNCFTIAELDAAVKKIGIDKSHPDAPAVAALYTEIKDFIQSASMPDGDEENF